MFVLCLMVYPLPKALGSWGIGCSSEGRGIERLGDMQAVFLVQLGGHRHKSPAMGTTSLYAVPCQIVVDHLVYHDGAEGFDVEVVIS